MSAILRATGPVAGGQERKTARHAVAGTPAPRSRVWRRALGVVLSTVKWVALALLPALAAAPVAVSLRWGPTPEAAALLLAAVWAALLVLLVLGTVRRRSARVQLAAALGLVLLLPATVVLSQATAYTPPITDAQGKVIPGSIATLEQVTLGGSAQWISIRGRRTDNPVLLWLAGGPGGSQLATARHHLRGLEERFVVVGLVIVALALRLREHHGHRARSRPGPRLAAGRSGSEGPATPAARARPSALAGLVLAGPGAPRLGRALPAPLPPPVTRHRE